MNQYEIVKITFNDVTCPHIFCTEPKTFEWLSNEVKKLIPEAGIRHERETMDGRIYSAEFYNLEDKDRAIYHRFMMLLCENGYEPFETKKWNFTFRKEIAA